MCNQKIPPTAETVFYQALDIREPLERGKFLSQACRNNDSLRNEVEELLGEHDRPDSFLSGCEYSVENCSLVDVQEGTRVGSYKVLQKLGEGGFGVVYMADQTKPIRRKVALKVIKPGMDSKEVVARFDAERQAMAMMDHPNIAKVLDAGTTEAGRPFFVMELVRGVSLTEYCDVNQLSTTQRLKLFVEVCKAVQHAHQKGVIHRDLKPTNVMVTLHDGAPVAKVIDFGVSKALSQQLTEKTLFTRYGQIVGTPQYMSPEQAEMSGLDIDTRSDIYSLGVLLYELLTGQPPFDEGTLRQAGFDGMRRLICDKEPPKPSTCLATLDGRNATVVAMKRCAQPDSLKRAVSGDLDWIVMKSLEKDRNRRYETASEFARDIGRHLNNEPVNAGPPSFTYQLGKLYLRHRMATLTAAAVAVSIAFGLVATTTFWLQAKAATAKAEELRIAADTNAAKADANATVANQEADSAKRAADRSEQTLAIVQELLSGAVPNVQSGRNVTVREFLDQFANNLDAKPIGDRKVEMKVRLALARSYESFGQLDRAKSQYALIEDLAAKTHAGNEEEYAKWLITLALDQSRLTGASGYFGTKSKSLLQKAIDVCEQHSLSDVIHVEALVELGTITPFSKPSCRELLETACEMTARMDRETKKTIGVNPFRRLARKITYDRDAAIRRMDEAVRLASLRGDTDDRVECELVLSRIHSANDRRKALQHTDSAIDIAKLGGSPQILLASLERRIALEFDQSMAAPESPLASVAERVHREMTEAWPDLVSLRPSALVGNLAGLQWASGDKTAALATLRLLDNQPSNGAHEFGRWLRRLGELKKSEFYASQAASGRVRHWQYPCQRARARYEGRNYNEAIEFLDQSLAWIDENAPSNEWASSWVRIEKALCLQSDGQIEASEQLFSDVTKRLEKEKDDVWGGLTPAIRLLAALFDEVGYSRDRTVISECQTRIQAIPFDERNPIHHAALGELLRNKGEIEAAGRFYVNALEERVSSFSRLPNQWINRRAVELLTEAGDIDRLERILRADIARQERQVTDIHPERAYVRIRLVEMLIEHDRSLHDATSLLTTAKELYDYHGDWLPEQEHQKLDELIAAVDRRLKVK